jgi:hypothetical protein
MTSDEMNQAIQFLIDHEARIAVRFEVMVENMNRLVEISEIQSRRLDRAERADREAQKRHEEAQERYDGDSRRRDEEARRRDEEAKSQQADAQKRTEDFQREALRLLHQILDRLIRSSNPNLN